MPKGKVMSPEQTVISLLYAQYEKNGFITEQQILDLCEKHQLSFAQLNFVSMQLAGQGVLITDDQTEDTDDYFDYAQTDYQPVYDFFLKNYPGMKHMIEYIQAIPPIQKGEPRRLLIQARSGNRFAKNQLIEKYLRIALRHTMNYRNRTLLSLEDIFSAAMLGVIRSLDSADPYRNVSAYVGTWIVHDISRYIADHEGMVRIPVHMREKIIRAKKIQRLNPSLSDEELLLKLQQELYVDAGEVSFILNHMHLGNTLSLDEFSHFDMPDDTDVPQEIETRELKEMTAKVLSALTDKEAEVLRMYFGLDDQREHTLEEIGIKFGVTRERIRQIIAKALKKLQHPSKKKYLKDFY